jgi:hypothetical protein
MSPTRCGLLGGAAALAGRAGLGQDRIASIQRSKAALDNPLVGAALGFKVHLQRQQPLPLRKTIGRTWRELPHALSLP